MAVRLGQYSTDILNLGGAVLAEIERRGGVFLPSAGMLLQVKTDGAAASAQEKLNAVWDVVFTLPFYRDLYLDMETAYDLFFLLRADRAKWEETLDTRSEGHTMFQEFLRNLEELPERIGNFRGQIAGMLGLYFEPLRYRSAEAYAAAYARYFRDMESAGAVLFEAERFEQRFPLQVKFVPMVHSIEDGKVILAEQAEFSSLTHFLYTDLYCGLMAGNAPRRCHNCGRFFLLTEGYNTCYCNGIAPGETARTCRKVGAHRKEAKERASATPAQKAYAKAYNRLKVRKQRGKISVDEWNTAVARAQELRDKAEQGELGDMELQRLFKEL